MYDSKFWQLVGFKAVKYKDCTIAPKSEHGRTHPEDTCHYEYPGSKEVHVSLPDMNQESLTKHALPVILDKGLLVETYCFKQKSGSYYSETEVWKPNTEVLKGERISVAFDTGFDLEEVTTRALKAAIWEALQPKEKPE